MVEFEPNKLYHVNWDDHWEWADGTWIPGHRHSDQLEPMKIKTIGWCTGQSTSVVRLASTVDQNGNFGGDITIMKKAITGAWEIKYD